MSTTMMPFLYQTRTLASNGWVRSTTTQFKHRGNLPRRNFTISACARARKSTSIHSITTTKMSSVEAPSAGSWAHNSELRAFTEDNYQSRPEDRPLIRKHMFNADAHKFREIDFDLPESIDFEEGALGDNELSGRDEIYHLTDRRDDRESTITPSERHAFQKIFSDIFQRYDESSAEQSASLIEDEDRATFDAIEPVKIHDPDIRYEKLRDAESNTAEIVSSAIPMSREQKEKVVNRYPAALRPAAARAIGLGVDVVKSPEGDIADREEAAVENARIEALREPERIRVEGLMKAAKTDFELWDIMEREVFSLISRMGLEELPNEPELGSPPTTNKRGRKSKTPETKKVMKEKPKLPPTGIQDDVNGVPPLTLYGPLYPSYMLLGLRLFSRSFATSSPLALSLLPKIKSMGFISHVLGASTQFYNELIRVYRYRYDDFNGILSLLSEMENAALEMDEETFEIVFDIAQTQISVHRGDKGRGVQSLWWLSEFAPGKFRPWVTKIQSAMVARELSAASHNDQFYA